MNARLLVWSFRFEGVAACLVAPAGY